MGFESGFADSERDGAVLPPWLSSIDCTGTETELSACERSGFGATGIPDSCTSAQRIFCSNGALAYEASTPVHAPANGVLTFQWPPVPGQLP